MKALCVGDLHLGQGVERYGPGRLADQAAAWSKVADLALEQNVDLVLFAGDGFERRRYPSQAELIAFAAPLRRLNAAGIPVVGIPGNHDVLAADGPTSLDLFSDVMTVAQGPSVVKVAGVSVACLPWTPISRLVATRGGGDRDALYQEAAALLHSTLRGLRAEIPVGEPAVLLAHWSVSGAVTPTGREAGLDFGVVLDTAELEAMGWDAVVLGHIHAPQVLHEGPWIAYTGSPLPLNFGEADTKHGVWIIDTDSSERRYVQIPSRAFLTIDLDLADDDLGDGGRDIGGLLAQTHHVKEAIIRLRYQATEEEARRIDQGAIKQALVAAGAWHVSIEPEILREDRARVHIETETLDELAALELWMESQGINGTRGAVMVERTTRYLQEGVTS